MKKYVPIFVSIVIAQLAGYLGSIYTTPNLVGWYDQLAKPIWNPPGWVFGPVWILLYTLMGIAAYLVWQKRETLAAQLALIVYALHLFLNTLWSVLFFGMQQPGLAFVEILLLLTVIVAMTGMFWRINKRAGELLVPYVAWVAFAAILNYSIWMLN